MQSDVLKYLSELEAQGAAEVVELQDHDDGSTSTVYELHDDEGRVSQVTVAVLPSQKELN